jgi:hypothetical protein
MFRFGREDINILSNALRLPEKIICNNRTVASGVEGLCIVLRRLAYPCRLEDLEPVLGRTKVEISYIFKHVIDYLYNTHNHLLSDLSRDWLSYEHLRNYAEAVSDRSSPLENCWGFIDGTVRPICRPQQNQKLVFNGHKRVHGPKFQSIVIPNGLISHIYGPIEGRRHDAGMLRESHVLAQMANHMTSPNGHIFSVYGDPAYPLGDGYIIPPYRGGAISRNQMIFNKRMSAVRICVEWAFGKVLSLFAYLDFKKKIKRSTYNLSKNIIQLLFYSLTVLRVCTEVKQAVSSTFSHQPPSRIFTRLTLK